MAEQAGFNIETWRSQVFKKGFLTPNQHLIRIPIPPAVQGNANQTLLRNTGVDLEFWIRTATIPGVSLATHNVVRYGYGSSEKRPFMPIFNDINLTVYSDRTGENLAFFKEWIRLIDNFRMAESINPDAQGNKNIVAGQPADPFELAYKKDYAVDVQMIVFADDGRPEIGVRMREAFPVFVGDIMSDWGDIGTIMYIPVALTFTDWYYDYDVKRLQDGGGH